MSFWQGAAGPIFSGGLSFLGGLGGLLGGGHEPEGGGAKKAKHHQLDYDRRRISALVNGAKDAGIHPLAVLGAASGSGGFAAPVSSGSNWGVGDTIGAGLSAAADTFSTLYESDQDRLEREEDRKQRERENAYQRHRDTLQDKQYYDARKADAETRRLQNEGLELDNAISRTRLNQMRAAAIGASSGGNSPDSVVTPFGAKLELPRSSSAQTMEDEFSDEVGSVYGFLRWLETQLTNPRTGEGYVSEGVKSGKYKLPQKWKGVLTQ